VAEKYYVYALVDPRDGLPFYVGKGCGQRMHQHECETRLGREKNRRKAARIWEIWAAGLEGGKQELHRCGSSRQALRTEAAEIKRLGDSLTNITRGLTQDEKAVDIVRWANAALGAIMPFDQWAAKRPRSSDDCEMYHGIVGELHKIAVDPFRCTREVIFSHDDNGKPHVELVL
jgi:hypothetical protein